MSILVAKKIKEEIERAERILLLTDERIDGDTIGSTLGMFHIIKDLGKEVTVFSPSPLHETLAFLPGTEVIRRDESVFEGKEYDLILIFDCADGEYIKSLLPKLRRPAPLVAFDHHATNPRYGAINYIENDAASTADVVWRFVKYAGFDVSREAAQCILTGICTDTDVFSTSNTTTACIDAAEELTVRGAKIQEIVRNTMMNKSVDVLKLWGVAFERLHQNEEFNAIATVIKQSDLKGGVTHEDLQGLSNFLNAMLEGADTVLVLYERKDGGVKGSLRSRTRDVASLAQKYGGGGHIRASGFLVENAKLVEKNGQWKIEKKKTP